MKILFISHDAGRTGAPLLLLNFMKWLKINTSVEFDLLLLKGGEFEREFSQLSCVYNWKAPVPELPNILIRIIRKITKHYPDYEKEYKKSLFDGFKNAKYDLIYANTVVTTSVVKELYDFLKIPVIVHIHELYGLTKYFSNSIEELVNTSTIKFIAVSKVTKQNLIKNHFVPENRIELIYEYIDIKEWLNIDLEKFNSEKFVISSGGFVQIRKGTDFFTLIAKQAIEKHPNIPWLFNWFGKIDEDTRYYYESDIQKLNLEATLFFTGQLKNPKENFTNSDVFLMISREDPFPLVCLEHAALAKPTICFDQGTGIKEFVEQGAGIVVKYMDIEATVDALAKLYYDKELYYRLSEKAKELVKEYDINIQAGKILSLIEKSINENQQ